MTKTVGVAVEVSKAHALGVATDIAAASVGMIKAMAAMEQLGGQAGIAVW
jgi:hypothetical protein